MSFYLPMLITFVVSGCTCTGLSCVFVYCVLLSSCTTIDMMD